MKRVKYLSCNFSALIVFVTLLCGCTGLSRQYKASTEGISIDYTVKKEHFISLKEKVIISSSDERLDKEVIGDGAKPTAGTRVLGYIGFGIVYAAMPDQPTLKNQQDPISIFKIATTERLSKNGIIVIDNKDTDALAVELLVRQFKLDFNFGKWIGEVGYIARVKKDGEIICQNDIYEKVTTFNWYGFGSGEKAIDEAFNKAIDKLDVNSCFSKLQK